MDSGKILPLAVFSAIVVATAAVSVREVLAQENMTGGGNTTEGSYTDMCGNMSGVSDSDSGNVSGLLGGF